MSNSIKVLVLVLSFILAACTLPSFSGSTSFAPTRSNSSPPRSSYSPPPVMQPSGAQSSTPSGETAEQARIRKLNTPPTQAEIDAQQEQYKQDSDPTYRVVHEVQAAQDDLNWITSVGSHTTQRAGAEFAADADSCSAYIAKQLASGAASTYSINIHVGMGDTRNTPITLLAAAATVCEALRTQTKDWDAKLDAAQAAEEAPYRKVGITGTKLSFTMNHSDGLVTVGQRVIVEPAQMARTNVFFMLLTKNDGTYLLERYEFSGNKLVSKTEQGFLLQPGPSHYR